MLKSYLCILAALIGCTLHAKNYLEDYLPSSTLVSVSLDDFKSLVTAVEEGKILELVSAQQKAEWEDSLGEPLETEDGEQYTLPSGDALTLGNLHELLSGRICGAIVSLEEGAEKSPRIVLLTDFAGDIEALKFLQIYDRDVAYDDVLLIEEPYAGVTLYTEEIADLPEEEWMPEYWTLVDGIAIEATSLELLKNTVDAVIDSRSDGLGRDPDFLRSMDIAGQSQARIYLNLKEGIGMFRDLIEDDMPTIPMNPLGVTMDSLWNSLALESLQGAFMAIDFESANFESVLGMLYTQRRGILELLAYSSEPLRFPHWVPSDAIDANVSMLDFNEVFAAFEALMNDMSPNFGAMFQLQLDNFRQQTNIDLREALLTNFGTQFASFSELKEADEIEEQSDNENLIVAIPIRDPQAFENAIKGLTETFAPGAEVLSEREFLGMKIVTPANLSLEDSPFGYALADDHLFLAIGSVELLERTLYHLRESDGGLWNESYIVNALEDLPPNQIECAYFNLSAALEQLFEAYRENLSGNFGKGIDVDLPELSGADVPFYILSAGYILEDAQITRVRVLPKNP
ncbi:hypothetical protein [Cerasicoccus frondis]|uniref:hypothetical protein n=1 Tax=Cerasicoccus frondis TaxID=490090 RepID=UPI002852B732|nr:hypothetical protein [Cerasicoccus frondis]